MKSLYGTDLLNEFNGGDNMHRDLYSNTEFKKIKEQLNAEIRRRGTFRWWDPLVPPEIGEDRTPPLTLPEQGEQMTLREETYTIDTPSSGSIERTRNATYLAQGDNPGGDPNTSSARFDTD